MQTWRGAIAHEKAIPLTINSVYQQCVYSFKLFLHTLSKWLVSGLAQENSVMATTYLFPHRKRRSATLSVRFITDVLQLERGTSDSLFWAVSYVLTVPPPFPHSHCAFCMAAMSAIPNLLAHLLGKLKQNVGNKKKCCCFVTSVR